MPPHCDTLDGPVVKAAREALEKGDVLLALPWAPQKAESEIISAFEKAMRARKCGKDAAEVADRWFFETLVRLHREGEGEPFTGLKPAGLDPGPVIPKAERAIESGDASEVGAMLSEAVKSEAEKRFRKAIGLKRYDPKDVGAARKYVEAMLDFLLYSHHTYRSIREGVKHGSASVPGRHAD